MAMRMSAARTASYQNSGAATFIQHLLPSWLLS